MRKTGVRRLSGEYCFDRECQVCRQFACCDRRSDKNRKRDYNGRTDQRLLRECSLGCKMAINSFDQMRDYVKNEELKELMDTYDQEA